MTTPDPPAPPAPVVDRAPPPPVFGVPIPVALAEVTA